MDKCLYCEPNKHMDKILERIYLGCFGAAQDLCRSNPQDIGFVVNCTHDPIDYTGTGIESIVLGFHDGMELPEEIFWLGIKAIKNALAEGKTIFIHCHAGISRSPSLTAAWLYLAGFDTLDGCVEYINTKRSILPHTLIYKSVKKHLKIFPYNGQFE